MLFEKYVLKTKGFFDLFTALHKSQKSMGIDPLRNDTIAFPVPRNFGLYGEEHVLVSCKAVFGFVHRLQMRNDNK